MNRKFLLLESLKNYYDSNPDVSKYLLNIVKGSSPISLRLLDWFITNYAKKYKIVYDIKGCIDDTICREKFFVFSSYRSQLKAYSKKMFDPFCRRERINFVFCDNIEIQTTIGQLNFFRWAIKHDILNYVEKHIKDIEEDMHMSQSKSKMKKIKNPKDTLKYIKYDIPIEISFN